MEFKITQNKTILKCIGKITTYLITIFLFMCVKHIQIYRVNR